MKTLNLINEQIKNEFYSAYLYLSMSAYFESIGLKGFSHWMRMQFEEEKIHAMKMFDYLNERGYKVVLKEIRAPKSSWKSCLEAFKDTLKHEKDVTSMINNIVEMANKEKDYASLNFLQWFISEQVEEEASAQEIVDKLNFLGEDKKAIYLLDKELGQRQPPVQDSQEEQ